MRVYKSKDFIFYINIKKKIIKKIKNIVILKLFIILVFAYIKNIKEKIRIKLYL